VQLTAEGARLWRSLKEHLGKDPLWRLVADWEKALLELLQAQAHANRSIRKSLEQDLGTPVLTWRAGGQSSRLDSHVVSWARVRAMKEALGKVVPALTDIQALERSLFDPNTSRTLADGLEDAETMKTQFVQTLGPLRDLPEVKVAAQSYRNLQEKTRRVHDGLEELLLIHHIPGRCGLCKKLAGQ